MDGLETLGSLVRSPNKVQLLERLSAEPTTADELAEAYDVHRRTIVRNLNDLEASGWVVTDGRMYRLAPATRVFLPDLLDVIRDVDTASRLVTFFECVSSDTVDIPIAALEDATVVSTDSNAEREPLSTACETVSASTNVRAVVPVLSPMIAEVFGTAIENDSLTETILAVDVADTLRSMSGHGLYAEFKANDVRVYVTDSTHSHGLIMTDRSVLIVGYDDGIARVLVRGDSPEFREWAMGMLDRQRTAARPVPTLTEEG
ncbi:helix-turn-helix transcriptional regulator [Halopiger goleimassiliensis]|uniref:helix-turn-helix transcriptional regulator n=1 Tax=Halopiger goleimassiliensis TaxID=1293048 RepID=UPI0006779D7E|nr:HTH domain-containing protein [Halopiger goleimassiliensis]